ncbi:glycosyltransferase family 4 protein [Streptomyces sp. MRC013]|uniref:glycosyltransferase family 4 protein n=1 Tax=Streptomyces sp. MRC013 TaxID=2898276 RepID=UPI002026B1E6|nr:glycosyltransferase family 4 protein [Streptomyces sp. MRC013]URM90388.1 glycosyltransferase family 4 protein [Streptomyces sp. MRC013]
MIPNTGRYLAQYRRQASQGRQHFTTKPVIAWDSDGVAQVVDHRTGRLVDADSYSDFARVIEQDPAPVVAAVPGGGWLVEHLSDDEGTWVEPVLLWNVRADGTVDPQCMSSDGISGDPTSDPSFVRLYHPDHEPTDDNSD